MAVAKRIRPLDLFTEKEWEHVSRRSDLLGLGMVAHAWAVLALAMAAAIWQPLLIIVAIPVIGARQLGLAVLMHEAAHGGLSTSGALNDFAGQWLSGAFVGSNLKAYRAYHLQHHKYTQQPEDPDLVLSAPFPITRSSLKRKIIRDLTGQTFYKQRSNQILNAFGIGIHPGKGAAQRIKLARTAAFPFLISNGCLLLFLSLIGYWWAFFALWLLPMATWNQMITRLRNIAEHAVLPDDTNPLQYARTTHAGWLERALLAPYYVNYHCEHHMFMHLPFYRLPAAHRLLQKKGVTNQMEVRETYSDVLSAASSKLEPMGATT